MFGRYEDPNNYIGVILHELIHCLIQKYKSIDEQEDRGIFT